jgi:PBS lyase HEAT-like repeat
MRNSNISRSVGMIISVMLCSLLCHEVNAGKVSSRQPDTINQEMQEKILSKDFAVAKKALDDNRQQKRVMAIRMSLKSQFLNIRKEAADAIRELQDKPSVPALIEALENNQVRYTGGSETQLMQAELNKSLLSGLQTLTGLNLTEGRELSDTQIKKAIQESKLWLDENKDRIK